MTRDELKILFDGGQRVFWSEPEIDDWIDQLPEPTPEEISYQSIVTMRDGTLYELEADGSLLTVDYGGRNCKVIYPSVIKEDAQLYSTPAEAIKCRVQKDCRYEIKMLERYLKCFRAIGNQEACDRLSKSIELLKPLS